MWLNIGMTLTLLANISPSIKNRPGADAQEVLTERRKKILFILRGVSL